MDHDPSIPPDASGDHPPPSPSLLGPSSPASLPDANPTKSPADPLPEEGRHRQPPLPPFHHRSDPRKSSADTTDDFEEQFPSGQNLFSHYLLPLLLFLLTIFTTLWAGAYQVNTKPTLGAWDFLNRYPHSLLNGWPFAVTLLGILVTHEFGHYALSRIHRVPASFPLFLPGPPHFIGTFGAVIRMRSPIMNRRALFDIGVAGPIAGFVAAVVAIIIGLSYSEVIPREHTIGLQLGEPLLLQFFAWLTFGPIPPTHDIVLHPIAFAAWFGFFVTAINLLPLGQLDGGHVVYAVLGRQQRNLAIAIIPIFLYLGFTGWPGWILWVGMASLVGVGHPPVADPHTALGPKRRGVAWAALCIFIVTFAPVPFSMP